MEDKNLMWVSIGVLVLLIIIIGQKKGWWKQIGQELSKPPAEGDTCIVSSFVTFMGKTPMKTNFIYGTWHNGKCEL